MAIWRNLELEQIFGGQLDSDGLTGEALLRLVDNGQVETELLDYKARVSLPRNADRRPPDFPSDTVAFANARGGVLLCGVREENATGAAQQIVGLDDDLEDLEDSLNTALRNFVAPAIEVHYVPIEVDDQTRCLAVIVPPSVRAPHAVYAGQPGLPKRPLYYPYRVGRTTQWMLEAQVADRYIMRGMAAAARQAHAESVVDSALSIVRRRIATWVWVAVVPDHPVAAVELDAAAVRQSSAWLRDSQVTSPLEQALVDLPLEVPAPGRTTFSRFRNVPFGQNDGEPHEHYVELHVDGCAFAAADLRQRLTKDEREKGVSWRRGRQFGRRNHLVYGDRRALGNLQCRTGR